MDNKKKTKPKTQHVLFTLYAQKNTNNVNKIWLQTTSNKDEPNIVFIQKEIVTDNMEPRT